MYWIIHNKHKKESREFVENFGQGQIIVDFYDYENQLTKDFYKLGIIIPDFPCVLDIKNKRISLMPSSLEQGIEELKGLDLLNIKQTIIEKINNNTQMLFDTGFLYNEKRFNLALHDQSNYQNLLLLKNELVYPVIIKTNKEDYISFNSSSFLEEFCKQALLKANEIIQSGYDLKQQIENMSYDQLKDFIDPRI